MTEDNELYNLAIGLLDDLDEAKTNANESSDIMDNTMFDYDIEDFDLKFHEILSEISDDYIKAELLRIYREILD